MIYFDLILSGRAKVGLKGGRSFSMCTLRPIHDVRIWKFGGSARADSFFPMQMEVPEFLVPGFSLA